MSKQNLCGFNTSLQQVDHRYSWINEMIQSRQDLVKRYMQLLEFFLEKNDQTATYFEELTTFCEHLIDYVSHGHFDLYPKIIELMENATGRSLSIARRAMPRIEVTTDILMQFNDKYAEDMSANKLDDLEKDLNAIGESLEQRFRNEDRLIVGLRLVHSIIETPSI